MKLEIKDICIDRDGDVCEVWIETDDGLVRLMRIAKDALRKLNGEQAFDMVMLEMRGLLKSIEDRAASPGGGEPVEVDWSACKYPDEVS